MQEYDHDVALSFAGEDRQHAEKLAALLKRDGYKVFYDEYAQALLWGENLHDKFFDIYKNKSRYCVMFVSKHYAQKLWTNHERRSAQARALEESVAYILPIRLDDTEIPGILPTVGYLDLRLISIGQSISSVGRKVIRTIIATSNCSINFRYSCRKVIRITIATNNCSINFRYSCGRS